MRFAIPEFRRHGSRALALAALLACASLPLAAQQGAPPALPEPRDTAVRFVGVLRPGDELTIVVYKEKDLSGKYLIDSRGNVTIPGIGIVHVGGLEPTEVAARLTEALREQGFTAPQVAVQPAIRVSILGAVRNQGLYPVDPGTTLIQLLTIAGGPMENADLSKTFVVRDGRSYPVDLELGIMGDAGGRVVLYSSDVVNVPKKGGLTRENLGFILTVTSTLLTLVTVIVTLSR